MVRPVDCTYGTERKHTSEGDRQRHSTAELFRESSLTTVISLSVNNTSVYEWTYLHKPLLLPALRLRARGTGKAAGPTLTTLFDSPLGLHPPVAICVGLIACVLENHGESTCFLEFTSAILLPISPRLAVYIPRSKQFTAVPSHAQSHGAGISRLRSCQPVRSRRGG